MSFLVKHSSAAAGDDTTTTRRDPNWREKIGPSFLEKLSKDRWSGPLMRWRWPNIGNFGAGLGGKRGRRVVDFENNLVARTRRRRERDAYNNSRFSSMIYWRVFISTCNY